MEDNADEAVNLDIDGFHMASDPAEDFCCDFAEEEPHSKRKLAEWVANQNVFHSVLSAIRYTFGTRSGFTKGSQNSPQYIERL